MISRRSFLQSSTAAGLLAGLQYALLPAWARGGGGSTGAPKPQTEIDLTIAKTAVQIDGRRGHAVTLNGGIPGPILRFRQGDTVTIRVHNELNESTSVHWHGILLPFEMDGVPGVSYPGIGPKETFTYTYPVRQSGTYWYHSHTGLQEQLGLYGPLLIEPEEPDPFEYDREHVIVLSDWMFENPYAVAARLKKHSDYLNFHKRTVGDFVRDAGKKGLGPTLKDRLAWGRMRMSPTDIADITGHIYTYLMNGQGPDRGWYGLFEPGQRVRLRFVNAATMSYFNVRIPGLPMTVVAADGQNVEPVTVDEMQMAVAETYDVIVEPQEKAYTVFAESMDRSGFARGTLAPEPDLQAHVPALRTPPLRSMFDMGMDMSSMDMDMDMDMDMSHGMEHMSHGSPVVARHGPDEHGPGNIGIAEVQYNRLGEPGTGLADTGHRVLVYNDLKALQAYNQAEPARELELHLTGNMERYMWSFDGKKFSEVTAPIAFAHGERLRLILVNDTMMEHPIHLHGMWMELENGHGQYIPRKHTVSVKPAERLSVLIDADAPGRWAFHCHLLYHMDMGMFRVVEVSPYDEGDTT